MFVPLINILIGAGLIVGGATEKLTLFGTDSSVALMAVGGVIAAIGGFQLVRALKGR